jgi:nucleoside-triphosphatase THEP1
MVADEAALLWVQAESLRRAVKDRDVGLTDEVGRLSRASRWPVEIASA